MRSYKRRIQTSKRKSSTKNSKRFRKSRKLRTGGDPTFNPMHEGMFDSEIDAKISSTTPDLSAVSTINIRQKRAHIFSISMLVKEFILNQRFKKLQCKTSKTSNKPEAKQSLLDNMFRSNDLNAEECSAIQRELSELQTAAQSVKRIASFLFIKPIKNMFVISLAHYAVYRLPEPTNPIDIALRKFVKRVFFLNCNSETVIMDDEEAGLIEEGIAMASETAKTSGAMSDAKILSRAKKIAMGTETELNPKGTTISDVEIDAWVAEDKAKCPITLSNADHKFLCAYYDSMNQSIGMRGGAHSIKGGNPGFWGFIIWATGIILLSVGATTPGGEAMTYGSIPMIAIGGLLIRASMG